MAGYPKPGEGIFQKIGIISLCRRAGFRTRGLLPEYAAHTVCVTRLSRSVPWRLQSPLQNPQGHRLTLCLD